MARIDLTKMRACGDAAEWVAAQPDDRTAWETCERGDWMLWLAARVGVSLEDVVLAACACARLALRHVPEGEERPRIAIETAERWARGEATRAEVHAAAYAANAAYAAANAAYAAAYAAYAAHAAAYAAANAAYAAAYAAYAAEAAAADDAAAARTATLRECADRVRAVIPWALIARAAEVTP